MSVEGKVELKLEDKEFLRQIQVIKAELQSLSKVSKEVMNETTKQSEKSKKTSDKETEKRIKNQEKLAIKLMAANTKVAKKKKAEDEKYAKEYKKHIDKLYKMNQGFVKLREKEVKKQEQEEKKKIAMIVKMNNNMHKFYNTEKKVTREIARQTKETKKMNNQLKIMTKLGQISMATYAMGRMKGYAIDLANMTKEQEKFNLQLDVLESKGKGWKKALQEAQTETRGLVQMHKLLASANVAESLGFNIDPKQFAKLAKQANKIALKNNEEFDVSFNKLMKGIGRGSIKLLDDFIPGIKSIEQMTKETAFNLGKQVDELSTQEKQQGRLLEVVRSIAKVSGDVTDEIIDRNTRVTQQLNKIEIKWNSYKKVMVGVFTTALEQHEIIKTFEQTAHERKMSNLEREYKAILKNYDIMVTARKDESEEVKILGEAEQWERNKARKARIKEIEQNKQINILRKKRLDQAERWHVNHALASGYDDMIKDVIKESLTLQEKKLAHQEAYIEAMQEEAEWAKRLLNMEMEKLADATEYQKVLGQTIIMQKTMWGINSGLNMRGGTAQSETFAPRTTCGIGYELKYTTLPDGTKTSGCVRKESTKKKGRRSRAKVDKGLDYSSYAKEYARNQYNFDVDKGAVFNDETQQKWYKIQQEAFNFLRDLKKNMVQEDIDINTAILKGNNDLEDKKLDYKKKMSLKAIELENAVANIARDNQKRRDGFYLQDKKELTERLKNAQAHTDSSYLYAGDKENLIHYATNMYDDRIKSMKSQGKDSEVVNLEKEKAKALKEIRETEVLEEWNYNNRMKEIYEKRFEMANFFSSKMVDIADEGFRRGFKADREEEEMRMRQDLITDKTEEGLKQRQRMEDEFNARKAYNDEIWLQRAVANATIQAGTQIQADGVTNVWKGVGEMLTPGMQSAGAALAGFGGLEIVAGLGMGALGEYMLPPEYQGMAEADGQKDKNELDNCDKEQTVVTYAFPSQRQFIQSVNGAVKQQRR